MQESSKDMGGFGAYEVLVMTNREFVVAYFTELWGYPPYEWQVREGVLMLEKGHFSPQGISAPLASGKTALLDFLILGMFKGHFRRGVHCINRRVLVSEVYLRAQDLAEKIRGATSGVLKEIADELRKLCGIKMDQDPLLVVEMQGGIHVGQEWLMNPAQPTLIITTVNHFGLRLLFDAPGKRKAMRMHAGLMAYDTYLILDEADSSRAFVDTLGSIQTILGQAERMVARPLQFTQVSATLGRAGSGLEPSDWEAPGLKERLNSSKRFEAHEVKSVADTLVSLMVKELKRAKRSEAYCIFMNTVRGSVSVRNLLDKKLREAKLDCQVEWVTGRMRPVDREDWQKGILPKLKSSRDPIAKPLIVVSTQCLEIGVDISFRGVISESCDLRSLIQRSGRCDREGLDTDPFFFVVGRTLKDKPDPVYGDASQRTLKTLIDNDVRDFGYRKLMDSLEGLDLLSLCTPYELPPVLTQIAVDALASNAVVKPSTIELLHGSQDTYEVRVLWRCDLDFILGSKDLERRNQYGDLDDLCTDLLEHCPPTDGECLTIPFYAWKQWLNSDESSEPVSPDIEGWIPEEQATQKSKPGWCIVWEDDPKNTHKKQAIITELKNVRPGDTIILQSSVETTLYDKCEDLAERSASKKRLMLRLNPSTYESLGLKEAEFYTLAEALEDKSSIDQATDSVLRVIEAAGSNGFCLCSEDLGAEEAVRLLVSE